MYLRSEVLISRKEIIISRYLFYTVPGNFQFLYFIVFMYTIIKKCGSFSYPSLSVFYEDQKEKSSLTKFE